MASDGSDRRPGLRGNALRVPKCSHALPSCSPNHSCSVFFLYLQGRSHLNHEKEIFAQDHPEVNSLEEVVRLVKPTAIIGRRVPTAQPS